MMSQKRSEILSQTNSRGLFMNKIRKCIILLAAAVLILGGCASITQTEAAFLPWQMPQPTSAPKQNKPLEYHIIASPILAEEQPKIYENILLLMGEQRVLNDVIRFGSGVDTSKASQKIKTPNGKTGHYYQLQYQDVHSWNDLEALLKQIYTESYIEEYFIPKCLTAEPLPLFTEYEGNLYRASVKQSVAAPVQSALKIYQYRTDTYLVSCKLDYGTTQVEQLYIGILRENKEKPYGYELETEFYVSGLYADQPHPYNPLLPLKYDIDDAARLDYSDNLNLFDDISFLMVERRTLNYLIDRHLGGIIQYKDVHNWADLEALFERVYTKEHVSEKIVPVCRGGENPLFTEHDGNLYHADTAGLSDFLTENRLIYRKTSDNGSHFITCELNLDDLQQSGLYIGILKEDSEAPYGYLLDIELQIFPN